MPLVVLLFLIALAQPAAAQTTLYVDADAAGANDGSSWSDAFTDLQSALAMATSTDQIWVAAGTYLPATVLNRSLSFRITGSQNGLALYGGFAGTEMTLGERDLSAGNETILSGDIGMPSDSTDNSYHVVYLDATTGGSIKTATVIDGFTITAGNANDPNSTSRLDRDGGGLLCNGSGSGNVCNPSLGNLTFTNNTAASHGGGMVSYAAFTGESSPSFTDVVFINNFANNGGALFNDARDGGISSPTLTGVTFTDNATPDTVVFGGGAIFNFASGGGVSSPIFTDVIFTGNTARGGGAVFNDARSASRCNPTFTDVTFDSNIASGNAVLLPSLGRFGGGALTNYTEGGESSPVFINVTFVNNSAAVSGGAIYSESRSGGVSSPTFTNVTFVGNAADQLGGAMYNYASSGASSPTLTNVTFDGNTAADGGAIFNDARNGSASSPSLNDVVFVNNSASSSGGAMFNESRNSGGTSSPTLTRVTFASNTAADGGAIFNDARNGSASSPTLTNVLFADNSASTSGGAMYNESRSGATSSPTLTNTTFAGNTATTAGGALVHFGNGGTVAPTITNTILWGNMASVGLQIVNFAATPTVSHSLLQGGLTGISENNGSSTTDGGGNLSSDPLFVDATDPVGPDDLFATTDDGLRLQDESPAIDAGTDTGSLPPTDILGAERVEGLAVDMGAYEAAPLVVTATSSTARGWRLLSVPIPATVADLTDINLVGGVQADPLCDSAAEGEPITLYTGYDGGQTTGVSGYTTPATYTDALVPGAGFFWFFFNPPASTAGPCGSGATESAAQPLPVALMLSGFGAFSDQEVTVDGRVANDDAFYLGGNAFAEDIDLGEATLDFVSAVDDNSDPVPLQNHVQVYDPELGGYVLLSPAADGGADVGSDNLAVWQGAWLERMNAAPPAYPLTLTYAASARTGEREPGIFIGRPEAGAATAGGGTLRRVRFALTGAVGPTERSVFDGAAAVVFAEGAGTGWDAFDGSKLGPLQSPFVALAPMGRNRSGALTRKAVESLSLEAASGEEIAVPLAFYTSAGGTFTLAWPEFVGFPEAWTLMLRDNATGQTVDLRAVESYAFEAGASGNWEQRFTLLATAPAVDYEDGPAAAFAVGAVYPNPSTSGATLELTLPTAAHVRAEVFDVLGRRVAVLHDGETAGGQTHRFSMPARTLPAGSYVVRVTAGERVEARRFTVVR